MTTIKPRLWHSIRQPVSEWVRRRGTVEKMATEYGYTVRILNDGQHWEFRRGVVMLEWWPARLDGIRCAENVAATVRCARVCFILT